MTEAALASFPGANGKIVFTNWIPVPGAPPDSDPDFNPEIYTMNADGTAQTNLTNTLDVDESQPAWSPDGSKIAFVATPTECCSDYEIYTMNADGTDRRALTDNDVSEGRPEWSPDGSKIVFSGFERGPPLGENYYPFSDWDLHVMNADGSGEVVIHPTFAPVDEHDPDWSPNGDKIVYRADRTGDSYSYDLHTMNPDGSGWTRLTHLSGSQQFGPSAYDPEWSPDAAKISFSSTIDGGSYEDVYVMDPDGSDITNVTRSSTLAETGAVWSPDGTKMAFAGGNGLDGSQEIYVMNVDGTGPVKLTNNGRDGPRSWDPEWQPLQNRPPDCSGVTADPSVLIPANRRFRVVSVSGSSDPDGDPVELSITRVTQDEPVRGPGDTTSPDAAEATAPNEVRLRAERNLRRDGRVYRIEFSVSDGRGGTCSGRTTVSVPHRRGSPAVDSAPPSYDSFGF